MFDLIDFDLSVFTCISCSVSLFFGGGGELYLSPVSLWILCWLCVCASSRWYCVCTSSCDPSPRGLTFSWWGSHGLCHRPTKLAQSFLLCSCVCFCLYGPFDSVSFHKFSRQLFAFSLRSSGLNSALLGPFNYVSLYKSLPQAWFNPLWFTGLKAPSN